MDGGSIPPSSTNARHITTLRIIDRLKTMTSVRRAAVAAAIAGLLASCGNTATAPTTCPTDEILPTMNRYVEDSVFIDTPWEPAPDTDLAAAIDAGGVACSYGIQEAEVGATILWAPADGTFDVRREQWKSDGQKQVDMPGTDEAWALQETIGEDNHVWTINVLIDGVWIQLNATFLQDLAAAQPLVDAAITLLRN